MIAETNARTADFEVIESLRIWTSSGCAIHASASASAITSLLVSVPVTAAKNVIMPATSEFIHCGKLSQLIVHRPCQTCGFMSPLFV